jgi:hypothetical protein
MSSNTKRWDEASIPNSGSSPQIQLPSVGGTEWIQLGWGVPVFPLNFYTTLPVPSYHFTEVSGTYRSPPRGEPEADEHDVEFNAQRARLIRAVRGLKDSAPNWSGAQTKVSAGAALTAEQFLFCLPPTVILPKVAPDGEGDVMFVWDQPSKECVVTVEPKSLHLVTKPGDPTGVQVSAQQFLGIQIPPSVLRHLPST